MPDAPRTALDRQRLTDLFRRHGDAVFAYASDRLGGEDAQDLDAMISRRKLIATGLGVTAGLVTAGCSPKTSSNASWSQPGLAAEDPPVAEVRVTVTPGADATKVSPTEPVVVAVEGGTLKDVSVSAGARPSPASRVTTLGRGVRPASWPTARPTRSPCRLPTPPAR